MTRTPDEIKRGMECCVIGPSAHQPKCGECPYKFVIACSDELLKDTSELVQQLEKDKTWAGEMSDMLREENKRIEAQNAELSGKIGQLQAERDAAVACIPRVCKYCKHDGPLNAWGESECELDSVFPNGCLNGNTGWEWRGVQKEG